MTPLPVCKERLITWKPYVLFKKFQLVTIPNHGRSFRIRHLYLRVMPRSGRNCNLTLSSSKQHGNGLTQNHKNLHTDYIHNMLYDGAQKDVTNAFFLHSSLKMNLGSKSNISKTRYQEQIDQILHGQFDYYDLLDENMQVFKCAYSEGMKFRITRGVPQQQMCSVHIVLTMVKRKPVPTQNNTRLITTSMSIGYGYTQCAISFTFLAQRCGA